jgi:general secretion pathway protein G
VNGEAMLKRTKRGFTLVKLMVVMAIIALLLALAMPRYFNHL